MSIRLEVWSDIGCPWCYIGSRHLSRALAGRGDVEVHWRAFLLQPGLPDEGAPAGEFYRRKFGGEAPMAEAFARVAQVGAEVGIHFDFDRLHAVNTRRAHQLATLAEPHGMKRPVIDALFAAHFEEGRNVGSIETLCEVAGRVGLPMGEDELRSALERGEGTEEVQRDLDEARALGIQAVPTFVANRRYAVSGAQPAAVLGRLFRAAAEAA